PALADKKIEAPELLQPSCNRYNLRPRKKLSAIDSPKSRGDKKDHLSKSRRRVQKELPTVEGDLISGSPENCKFMCNDPKICPLTYLDDFTSTLGNPTASSSELQASEVQSLFTGKIKTIWTSPPEYAWYDAKCQGLSLQCTCSRLAQTTLPRIRTGHIKSLIFNGSEKTYASCRCSAMASHIIACIDASVRQLLNVGGCFLI
ncbi:RNase H domain-containing protein, partial [Trichonephila clavata]